MQAARARAFPVRDAQGGLPELRREGGTGAVGGRKEPSDEELRLVPRRLGQADGLERRGIGELLLRSHRELILNWFRARGQLSARAVEGLNGKVRVITKRAQFKT